MIEKRRCPNCGAFLNSDDSKCYVCGEEVHFSSDNTSEDEKVIFEPEQNNDFVTPVAHESAPHMSFKDRMLLSEDDYAEPFDDEDKPVKKSSSKKVLVICIVIVVLALVGAGVVVFKSGFFDSEKKKTKTAENGFSVYFDKPSEQISLFDSDHNEYRWSGDVEISFTLKGKNKSKSCTIHNAYANLWECELPAGAENICFGNPEKTIKTVIISDPIDGAVYYVTNNIIGADGLEVDYCDIREFNNDFGINYPEETTATETATSTETTTASESETDQPTEGTTAPEHTDANYYTVTLPDAWRDGSVDIVTDDNKTVYYDNYNHSMYEMGMLLAIYVYDSNDTSYKEKKYAKAIKSSDGAKIIVVETPSGMEFADSDKKGSDIYGALSNYTNQVINSITVK